MIKSFKKVITFTISVIIIVETNLLCGEVLSHYVLICLKSLTYIHKQSKNINTMIKSFKKVITIN